ncbi:MAG TPA: PIN domain-containing protein [Chitinophagaceae bacterium]|nr:PIN domain-containing protein [Chitinophagaceae bacterium]
MIIIPDSNILISALINGKGKEFRLLTGSYKNLSFATPSYLVSEINIKVDKIRKKTANTAAELSANIAFLLQHISVIDEEVLPGRIAKNAVQLLRDIDLKDVLFVALMLHLDALL